MKLKEVKNEIEKAECSIFQTGIFKWEVSQYPQQLGLGGSSSKCVNIWYLMDTKIAHFLLLKIEHRSLLDPAVRSGLNQYFPQGNN